MFQNPALIHGSLLSEEDIQNYFDQYYEDIFVELAKYGEIEELIVCDNLGDHLMGNVYVRSRVEDSASKAVEDLNKRFYAGRPLKVELSPVTDFRESCCRQFDMGECNRGGFCNFMHVKQPRREVKRELYLAQRLSVKMLQKPDEARGQSNEARHRSRSRSPRGHRR